MLWKIGEPIDTMKIIAHAAKIPNAELQVTKLKLNELADKDDKHTLQCVVLPVAAARDAQEWYMHQGLWPYAATKVLWGERPTLLMSGYPSYALTHPAGQVNIERALATFRTESNIRGPTGTNATDLDMN